MASSAYRRALGRIEQACSSAADERMLRAEVLAEIRRVVDFDSYVWLLTDPVSTVGSAPLADVPCMPRLPELIALKYLSTPNRWTSLIGRTLPVGALFASTGGDRAQSMMWRELLHELDIADMASVVFADRNGCWGFLDLWRSGAARPFDSSEVSFLAGMAAPICRAIRLRQAATFRMPHALARPETGPAVLILDDNLVVVSRTAAAIEWLRSLLPPALGTAPIPAAVYNVTAQLLANEAGIDDHPAEARAYVAGHTWVTLRASRLAVAADGTRGLIAVSIEETTAGPRLDLFARSHGLSGREQQLLSLLSRGADTADIADYMTITENTVHDHLKSIFGKTALNSRSALITTAIGPRTLM